MLPCEIRLRKKEKELEESSGKPKTGGSDADVVEEEAGGRSRLPYGINKRETY